MQHQQQLDTAPDSHDRPVRNLTSAQLLLSSPESASCVPAVAINAVETAKQSTARRRGNNRRIANPIERDPDYDRLLPVQGVPDESSAGPPTGQTKLSQVMYSSTELLSKPRQLYDPKTDPIPAVPKAQQPQSSRIGTTKTEGEGGKRRRERRRRKPGNSDNKQSNELNRFAGGKLYNPDSEIEDADAAAEMNQNQSQSQSTAIHQHSGRRRGIERKNRPNVEAQDSTPNTRESGKMMVLKNPKIETSNKHTGSKIVPQLDYHRDTVDEIEQKVRSLYSKISYLESQCLDIDAKQERHNWYEEWTFDEALWWDIIKLHESLLEEYEDFLLICNLVNATSSILNLPRKYKIPSRLWKNGISKLLESLRLHLPNSYDALVSFIYYTYRTVARLYEFVPTNTETWLECLGDLARCRMGVENISGDRKVWQDTAFAWYVQSLFLTPGVGRLYHHLALCSEPVVLDQLYYHSKSLLACTPFLPSHESMLPLFAVAFEPYVKDANKAQLVFAKCHGMQLTKVQLEEFGHSMSEFLRLVNRPAAWSVDGVKYAIANIASLFQYGHEDGLIRQLVMLQLGTDMPEMSTSLTSSISSLSTTSSGNQIDDIATSLGDVAFDQSEANTTMAVSLEKLFRTESYKAGVVSLSYAKRLSFSMLKLALSVGSTEHYPHIFMWLVFLDYIKDYEYACDQIFLPYQDDVEKFPWTELLYFLKTLTYIADEPTVYDWAFFPSSTPLCEDWAAYGLEFATKFPWSAGQSGIEGQKEYFSHQFDYDELETLRLAGSVGPIPPTTTPATPNVASTADDVIRVDRILWIGFRLAKHGAWFEYDTDSKQFSLSQFFKAKLELSDVSIDVPAG
ncbi:hypothetical protein V1512DRAFT_257829 [Lipomyces arxii]|uniref:uncharacterized protein n=1 Tax=Lipomyces arxii TaxID=56418 RepID=UPI0034CD65F2